MVGGVVLGLYVAQEFDRVELGVDLLVGGQKTVLLLVDSRAQVPLGRRRQVQLTRHGDLQESDQRRINRSGQFRRDSLQDAEELLIQVRTAVRNAGGSRIREPRRCVLAGGVESEEVVVASTA